MAWKDEAMIPLETAVADYRARCQASTINNYPLVWAGHYSDKHLGSYGVPKVSPETVGNIAWGVMAPFSFTDSIHTSYLVIDGAAVPEYQRVLFVSRLAVLVSGGILTTSWVIPYRISDVGTVLDDARLECYQAPRVHLALSELVDERQRREHFEPFVMAYEACRVHLIEIMERAWAR